MATLPKDANSSSIPVLKLSTTQTVAVGGSSVATATALASHVVRVVADTDCHVVVGTGATTSDAYLPAGIVEYFSVGVGDVLSFIQSSSSGTAYVTNVV